MYPAVLLMYLISAAVILLVSRALIVQVLLPYFYIFCFIFADLNGTDEGRTVIIRR
jgi:hypothetical protein